MSADNTQQLQNLRDVLAAIAAAISAAAALIAQPQWPTAALILLVGLMGYLIWRMLHAMLQQMRRDLEDCRKAHAECSERFQQVLDLLAQPPAPKPRRKRA